MKISLHTLAVCSAAAFALGAAPLAAAQDNATPAEATPPAETTASDSATPAEVAAPAETTAPAVEATTQDASAPAATATPSETTSSITGAPPAGKGLVVFFRPSRMAGMVINFTAREGETEIGRLSNGRYLTQAVDPGIHEFNIRGGETIRIEVEEGETHFLQLNIAMGFMSGRGVLAPSDRATFEERPLRAASE